MPKSKKALTERDRAFVAEYLKDHNASAAYVRAGYAGKNANVNGPRMLAKAGIASEIEKGIKRVEENAELTASRVLKRLMAIAEADIRQAFNDDGTLKPISEIPDSLVTAIAGIESDDAKGDVKKIKMWDKVRALELLGKHLKLFDEGALANLSPLVINIAPASPDTRGQSH